MNMELAELVTNRAEMHELERTRQAQKKAQKNARIQYFLVYGTLFLIGVLAIAHINMM